MLTLIWQTDIAMTFPTLCKSVAVFSAAVLLPSCADEAMPASEPDVIGRDPVIARALADPLMIDPDLAWINEANAAITFTDNHALPAFSPDPQAAARARDAARLELREDGTIEDLPAAQDLPKGQSLFDLPTLRDILSAAGAPEECGQGASDDLAWAAKMPKVASIMPHGMVQQGAGSDRPECAMRVIRYLTQTDAEDALQYHLTLASRAGLEVSYKTGRSQLVKGERSGETMLADVSDAPSGLRMVTLVHWAK